MNVRHDIEMASLRLWFTILVLVTISTSAHAQKVYTTPYASPADAVLYETKIKSEADILIYKVDYASQVNPSKGLWQDVKFRSDADWVVYWTGRRSESSCVVYFVTYRSQATRNKCYLGSQLK